MPREHDPSRNPLRTQVTCVTLASAAAPAARLRAIGGRNDDGSRWEMSEHDAILCLEHGLFAFYVEVHGRPVALVVATLDERKYLKSIWDATEPTTLLALPACPM